MSASIDDVTDAQVARCETHHFELHTDCPVCPTRSEERYCAACEQELLPHETCPECHDDDGYVVDGFGRAMVTSPVTGVLGS